MGLPDIVGDHIAWLKGDLAQANSVRCKLLAKNSSAHIGNALANVEASDEALRAAEAAIGACVTFANHIQHQGLVYSASDPESANIKADAERAIADLEQVLERCPLNSRGRILGG